MEGAPVGFGALDHDLIRSLYVDPLHQRKGIGSKILSVLEQTAGSRRMRVLSVHSALNAVPFYEVKGYSVIKPGLCIFSQMVTMRCMEMEKPLEPTR
jgi:putative acetyltransferase